MMLDYNGRRFRDAGESREAPVAHYHQRDNLLWGEFGGGPVRRGALVGTCGPDGVLDFGYVMVTGAELISGRCHSVPDRLPDGRIRLTEHWERFLPQPGSGISYLEEISRSCNTNPQD